MNYWSITEWFVAVSGHVNKMAPILSESFVHDKNKTKNKKPTYYLTGQNCG